jgi:hypothetical protein
MKMSIIAVGYEFDVPIDEIIEKVKKIKPDIDFSKYKIESHVRTGVWFNESNY